MEVVPNAEPPVCRVIEYHKFLYEKKKKEKEIKAKTAKSVVKEIRFGPNTDEHDFNFKVKPVSYTHLRAHETVLDLVCRLLLEKKKKKQTHITNQIT